MNLLQPLKRALSLWAEKEALVDQGKRFTYRQFSQRVARLANVLSRKGLRKGDRLAVMSHNGHEFMECYYGAAAAGAVVVPVNFRLSAREIAGIMQDAGVRLLIAHSDFAPLVKEAAGHCHSLDQVIWLGGNPAPGLPVTEADYEEALDGEEDSMPELTPVNADDLAQLYYTSGTTGRPKGVMLTHGNVTFHALAALTELKLTDADTWLHAAPLFHLADAWSIFAVTLAGGKHIFVPAFQPVPVLDALEREAVTATVLVPTMASALVNHESAGQRDFGKMRLILTGGSPVAPDLVRRIMTTFGCDYAQLYGMTETSPILTLSFLKEHMRAWPAEKQFAVKCRTGRPFIGAEVKVVRADGQEVAWNNEEVGEIIASGPGVTPGYWKQPEATAETVRNGWIYTGDLAVVDSEGYINIVDRKKDMIITGGENVFSTEVEHALYEHPAVLECAVLGAPDPTWGEAVKAIVVVRPGKQPSERELIDFVRERLAHYKAPRTVEFVSELPKTGSGKIYKKGLRDSYWAGQPIKV